VVQVESEEEGVSAVLTKSLYVGEWESLLCTSILLNFETQEE
jgi:hypothetical protein